MTDLSTRAGQAEHYQAVRKRLFAIEHKPMRIVRLKPQAPEPEPKPEPVLPMVRGVAVIKPREPAPTHGYEYRPLIRRKARLPRDILFLDGRSSADTPTDIVRPGHRILMEVAEKHQVSIRELRGPRHTAHVVIARQEACYRLAKETAMSLPQIGKLVDRDHTTVLYSVRKVERMIAEAQKESAA